LDELAILPKHLLHLHMQPGQKYMQPGQKKCRNEINVIALYCRNYSYVRFCSWKKRAYVFQDKIMNSC